MIYDIQPRTGILVEMERNALQNGHSIKSVGSQGVTRDTQISRLQDTSSNQVTIWLEAVLPTKPELANLN